MLFFSKPVSTVFKIKQVVCGHCSSQISGKDYHILIINFQVYEVCLRQKLPGKLIHLFLHLSLMRIENLRIEERHPAAVFHEY